MAIDEKLAERVRKALALRGKVTERRMMGGLAFMVDGAMCCAVGKDSLLVRVSADERDAVLARPHVSPVSLGARVMQGFVGVSARALRTGPQLVAWLQAGLAGVLLDRGSIGVRRRQSAERAAKRTGR